MGCCKTVPHGPSAPFSNPETSGSWANGTSTNGTTMSVDVELALLHVTLRDTASCPAS
jgi:hypothetical protein